MSTEGMELPRETVVAVAAVVAEVMAKMAAGNWVQPILLSRKEAADLCGVSLRTWGEMELAGLVPVPLRITSRVVRYSRETLLQWIRDGCPRRGGRKIGEHRRKKRERSLKSYRKTVGDVSWFEFQQLASKVKGDRHDGSANERSQGKPQPTGRVEQAE